MGTCGAKPIFCKRTVISETGIGSTTFTVIDTSSPVFANMPVTVNVAYYFAKADENGVKTITLEVSEVAGAKEYLQKLPAGMFVQPVQGDSYIMRAIVINTPIGSMTVSDNKFESKDLKKSETVSISIGMADASELDKHVKDQIGNKSVIELNAIVEGKKISWNNTDAPVDISIDYQPTADEVKNPECIVVWYIDGKGKVQSIANGRYGVSRGF